MADSIPHQAEQGRNTCSTDKAAAHHCQRQADGQACLRSALDFLQRGWSVLAICPPDHMGVGKKHGQHCKSPGKAPWGPWKAFQDRLPTRAELQRKWGDNPTLNVGIALGPVSGLVRVDVDGPGGEALLRKLSSGDLPDTLEFTSGRNNGGRGLLYKIPAGVTLRTTAESPGAKKEELRFQAKGAQTVLPPSRHPSGSLYAWVPGHSPNEMDAALAPQWLLAELLAEAPSPNGRPKRVAKTLGQSIPEGQRDSTLASIAGTMRHRGMSAEAIEAALRVENESRCDPPLSDGDVSRIAQSVGRYPPGNDAFANSDEPDVHLTDLGNARRVVARHGHELRFCHPWKSWLTWDGRRWADDTTAEIVRRVNETQGILYQCVASQIQHLGDVGDDDERKKELARLTRLLKHALAWEDARAIDRCLKLATSEPRIPILPAQLDADPLVLNVLNGTIDLRTGRLREHRRDDLLTKLAPVEYDTNATCPRWLRFLERIMDRNGELISYLQRVVGYCLSGDVSEQCLWLFHGGGANGKSTFLGAILSMLGDYAMQAVSELLVQKHNESHPTERADLFGKRFVCTIETEQGKRMAEALMKQLTGGDKVRARKMKKDFFEFEMTAKLVMAANHKPEIRGTDYAVWRRIKLVPFIVTISDEDKDKELLRKLKAELPGILRWAVEGCLAWQRHGLGEPDEIRQATARYQADQDVIATFLATQCILHSTAKVQTSRLFSTYQEWSGDKTTTQKAFTEVMAGKGYPSVAGTGNRKFYQGVGLPD
jgi:putative DNA primase/helicase